MLDETEQQTEAAVALHNDGWSNALSGFGDARDKRTAGLFSSALRLAWKELRELFAGDDQNLDEHVALRGQDRIQGTISVELKGAVK